MKIDPKRITIKEISKNYINNDEEGVVGYNGKLNIRPKYQREFIYKDPQRDAVIKSVRNDFPLNVMYWVKNKDKTYEVMDGQQRTISICEYVAGKFSINFQYFHNLEKDEQEQILNYPLTIYFCEGTDKEKLEWFKIINIAGEKLTDQERRNAIYQGSWITDAKKYFSQSGCPASGLASDYLKGASIRQEYLETTLKWVSDDNIEKYMADHQHKPDAKDLWKYFTDVIDWTKEVFPNYRKEMKGVPFGFLFNKYKKKKLNAKKLEDKIKKLLMDDEITNHKGIYSYVLTDDEIHLNLRKFSNIQKRRAYEKQKGICPICNQRFEFEGMHGHHKKPWIRGGKTTDKNCQMLCSECNVRLGAN